VPFIFYLAIISLFIYFSKKRKAETGYFEIRLQEAREKINILKDAITRNTNNKQSLVDKIERYHNLKGILVNLNQNLELQPIADNIVSISFSLVAKLRGVCLLHLIDSKDKVKLKLFKSKKQNQSLVIKTKEGDIFDLWVLRHTSPLLVEDSRKDFRFDLEKSGVSDTRQISSLISSPLVSEDDFLGILRLDNPQAYFYSQDDLRLLVTISDISAVALENGQLFQKTQELAIRDGLTSFYRKEYFLERLAQECKRCRLTNEKFSLLMLDIDYFKDYNDKFGHTAGDIVLKSLSQAIVGTLKGVNSLVGRFGGEEFCITLSLADKNKAHIIAEDLRLAIENKKVNLRRKESSITVSVGVATFITDADDEKQLIFKADRAMYEAKRQGRNKVVDA